jgi:DNA-binding transcriptional regulator LsrR (DeoR family)
MAKIPNLDRNPKILLSKVSNKGNATTPQDKKNLMTQVGVMRYKLGYTQVEIADRLNLSTTMVSRLLDQARDEGIITITVNTPITTEPELEKAIQSRYGIKEVIVVKVGMEENKSDHMARALAFYLDMIISPGDVLGIGGGRSITPIIPYLKLNAISNPSDLEIVQLAGGFPRTTAHNPIIALHKFTLRFGIKGYFAHLPAYAPPRERKIKMAIEQNYLNEIKELWKKCTLSLSGVGICGPKSIFCIDGVLSEAEMKDIEKAGAIGEIFGRWFDKNGHYLDHDINHRAISISPEILQKIPKRVLISYVRGKEWIRPIRTVLNMNVFNIFITNEETARLVI